MFENTVNGSFVTTVAATLDPAYVGEVSVRLIVQ